MKNILMISLLVLGLVLSGCWEKKSEDAAVSAESGMTDGGGMEADGTTEAAPAAAEGGDTGHTETGTEEATGGGM